MDAIVNRALAETRDYYNESLRTVGTLFRDEVEDGAKTGARIRVRTIVFGIALYGSGGTNSLINSLVRQITVKNPGERTLSFDADEDIYTGDYVVEGEYTGDWPPPDDVPYYHLGIVNKDDDRRHGLQVTAELMRVAPLP